jgi:L-aspartate oxidase
VYSEKIYHFLANATFENNTPKIKIVEWKTNKSKPISQEYISRIKSELQLLMQHKVGIVRNDYDLSEAKTQLEIWKKECEEMQRKHKINKDFYELKNMIDVAILIVTQSIDRKENRGSFVKK